MPVYQLDPSSLQAVYNDLQRVANTCRDDDQIDGQPTSFADSYISNCDLANLNKMGREKINVPLKDPKSGAILFAKKDDTLQRVYSNLRKLDEADGNLDGKIESKGPLTIALNDKDWNHVVEENRSAVVGVKLKMANGAEKAGSAFVVGREGQRYTAWTAAHVVDDIYRSEREVRLILFNNEEVLADVIGIDHYADFGIITFDSEVPLSVAKLGDSDDVRPLDEIMTLGNRLDEGITSMRGQVVSKDIGLDSFYRFDVMKINDSSTSGDSGGPTFNERGEVIGIVSKVEKIIAGGNLTILVPINHAKASAMKIKDNGRYAHAGFGNDVLDRGVRSGLGLVDNGVVVSYVAPNSPASTAGLQAGDVILKIDGKKELVDINNPTKMCLISNYIMNEKAPGDMLNLTVWRDGKKLEISVKLEGISFEKVKTWQTKYQFTAVEPNHEIKTLARIKEESGVFVELDNESAKQTSYRLPSNSIITHVGAEPVSSVEEFKEAVLKQEKKGDLVFRFIRTVWSGGPLDKVGYVSVPTD